MTPKPTNVQLIGSEVAIVWSDGREDYYPMSFLRANSPSAEQAGERDIFGTQYGGSSRTEFEGVTVVGFETMGAYALRFEFSDGHRTGLYSFEYLRKLGDHLNSST